MQGINFVLYEKNLSKRTGMAPVMIRFFVGGRKKEINTKVYVNPRYWDDVKKCVKKSCTEAPDMNLILHNQISRIVDIFTKYRLMNKELTWDAFEKEFTNFSKEHDFFGWLQKECLSRMHLGIINEDSRDHHLSVFAKLQSFNKNLTFNDITPEQLDNWRKYMRIRLGNKPNTIHASLKCIKTYLNIALKNGIIEKDVFAGYKLPATEKHDIYLQVNDLKLLEEYRNTQHIKDESHRASVDVFLFCCYTGLGIGELRALHVTEIIEVQNMKYLNVNQRVKNRPSRLIPLMKKALKLIDLRHTDKLMYIPADAVINREIKRYLVLAGITPALAKKITLHKARHTFATILISELNADIQTVSKLLGHRKVSTTLETYSHLLPDKKNEYLNKFDNL